MEYAIKFGISEIPAVIQFPLFEEHMSTASAKFRIDVAENDLLMNSNPRVPEPFVSKGLKLPEPIFRDLLRGSPIGNHTTEPKSALAESMLFALCWREYWRLTFDVPVALARSQ